MTFNNKKIIFNHIYIIFLLILILKIIFLTQKLDKIFEIKIFIGVNVVKK